MTSALYNNTLTSPDNPATPLIPVRKCPNLLILNLDDNRLESLAHFKGLVGAAKSLAHLSLSNNNLASVTVLEGLRGLPLQELNLSGINKGY